MAHTAPAAGISRAQKIEELRARYTADRDAAEAAFNRRLAAVASAQAVMDSYAAQGQPIPTYAYMDYQSAVARAAGFGDMFGFAHDLDVSA